MLTKQQIIDQFKGNIHCSQVVLGEYAERLGYDREEAMKIAAPFGGGMFIGNTCGAVAGAMIAIGMKYGNGEHGNKAQDELCQKKVRQFREEFEARNKTIVCRELLGYDFRDDEQKKAAFTSGTVAQVCPGFVQNAIEILGRILEDEG